jgi:hypothetical protein
MCITRRYTRPTLGKGHLSNLIFIFTSFHLVSLEVGGGGSLFTSGVLKTTNYNKYGEGKAIVVLTFYFLFLTKV